MPHTFSDDSFLPEGTGKTEETSEAEYLMENSPMMNGMADGMHGGNIWDWIFDKTIGLPDEYVEAKYGGEYSQEFKNAQLAGNSIPILYGGSMAAIEFSQIANIAKYGAEFGKMGKYVKSPNIVVNWSEFAAHGLERMSQRGVTQDMVNSWVKNGKALAQNGGEKFAYITKEGVAIVSKGGKLITAWGADNFDDAMKYIVEQLYGK